MRSALLLVAMATATVSAEPVRGPTCEGAATRVAQLVTAGDRGAQKLVAVRCERDRWAVDARACFAQAGTDRDAATCLDRLSKDQQRQLAGDVDRSTNRRVGQWLARRPSPPIARAPLFTLAVQTDAPDVAKVRTLHAEGMTAYRSGRYDVAVRKF